MSNAQRPGRPRRLTTGREDVTLVLTPELRAKLDDWAENLYTTRSEAARYLLSDALRIWPMPSISVTVGKYDEVESRRRVEELVSQYETAKEYGPHVKFRDIYVDAAAQIAGRLWGDPSIASDRVTEPLGLPSGASWSRVARRLHRLNQAAKEREAGNSQDHS